MKKLILILLMFVAVNVTAQTSKTGVATKVCENHGLIVVNNQTVFYHCNDVIDEFEVGETVYCYIRETPTGLRAYELTLNKKYGIKTEH